MLSGKVAIEIKLVPRVYKKVSMNDNSLVLLLSSNNLGGFYGFSIITSVVHTLPEFIFLLTPPLPKKTSRTSLLKSDRHSTTRLCITFSKEVRKIQWEGAFLGYTS